ncbi:MAG: SRPBCC family protein [Bacteroidales bacterium]|nr:SRPBCC family protein [Bacteroidales bacterium]
MSLNVTITIETTIEAPIQLVWNLWTLPEHIVNWNFASEEWCCPNAVNDLRPDGELNWRMEAKDGGIGFDFTGTYLQVKDKELITYKISDGRAVSINFLTEGKNVKLIESFEAEGTNSEELQRSGWQAILNNFKRYVESVQ